ncbi:MAG: right-handed parallel beta-helix repeat-containing protein [Thermoplasmatales archaeon]|nr:right-handed parallel beta-helix repeat-containing protein [Thermoplasmatales archaeon]
MKIKYYKIIINFILIILIVVFSGCIDIFQSVNSKTIFVDINGKFDFVKIQDAINNSSENDTIFVYNGVYFENIIINKNLNLIGENKTNTIIDANKTGDVIYISDLVRVNISGFTLKNSGIMGSPNMDSAIDMRSNYNIIRDNIIISNEYGIFQLSSHYNNISNNKIYNNKEYGIYLLSNSNYNKITDNVFSLNSCGIRIKGSRYNELNRNIFQGNQKGVYFCCGAQQNIVYNNVFINNSLWHAQDTVGDNYWNYEEIGNYWDDYNLSEEKPYIITYKGQDNYPIANLSYIEWHNSFS